MKRPLLEGALVRLTVIDPEEFSALEAGWRENTEYWRLLATDPALPIAAHEIREDIEKSEPKNTEYAFAISTLTDQRVIGVIGLDGILWNHRLAWVGIGIGEPEYWGKGYGTDAMREILRYGFEELNLFRVNLDVFAYNQRAIRSYEKVGFVREGRVRQLLFRDGQRWDLIYMGILRSEWQAQIERGDG